VFWQICKSVFLTQKSTSFFRVSKFSENRHDFRYPVSIGNRVNVPNVVFWEFPNLCFCLKSHHFFPVSNFSEHHHPDFRFGVLVPKFTFFLVSLSLEPRAPRLPLSCLPEPSRSWAREDHAGPRGGATGRDRTTDVARQHHTGRQQSDQNSRGLNPAHGEQTR